MEQPQGSLLWEWDSIKKFFDSLPIVYEAKLKMGWFGAKCEKPLDFRGSWQGLQYLQLINDESGKLIKESGALNDVERVKLATKGKRLDPHWSKRNIENLFSSEECLFDIYIYNICIIMYIYICIYIIINI